MSETEACEHCGAELTPRDVDPEFPGECEACARETRRLAAEARP